MARPKKALISNEQSFRQLLSFLDPDAERAGARYERLREKLIRSFERRRCWQADLVADRTFRRVEELLQRKNFDGPNEGRNGFVMEVGRRVLSEWWDENKGQAPPAAPPIESPSDSKNSWQLQIQIQIYDLCKSRLPDGDRTFLEHYFRRLSQGEGNLKDMRRDMAARQGISLGALRVRIHTIRAKLEASCLCCARCLGVSLT